MKSKVCPIKSRGLTSSIRFRFQIWKHITFQWVIMFRNFGNFDRKVTKSTVISTHTDSNHEILQIVGKWTLKPVHVILKPQVNGFRINLGSLGSCLNTTVMVSCQNCNISVLGTNLIHITDNTSYHHFYVIPVCFYALHHTGRALETIR